MRLTAANFYVTLAVTLLLSLIICYQLVRNQQILADNRQTVAQLSSLETSCQQLFTAAVALHEARRLRNTEKEYLLSQKLSDQANDLQKLLKPLAEQSQNDAKNTSGYSLLVNQAGQLSAEIRAGRESLSNLNRLDTLVREQLPASLKPLLAALDTEFHGLKHRRIWIGCQVFLLPLASLLWLFACWWRERQILRNTMLDLLNNSGTEITGETALLLGREQATMMPEKQLELFVGHFQSLSRKKDNFFAVMSHEIRTPLNGLIGFLSNLGDTQLNDQQRQYFRIIHSSAKSLLHVINEILDFSKINAGQLTLDEVAFDLRGLVEERLSLAKSGVKQKNLKIHLDFPGAEPLIIRADPARLRQVLDNLLGNAVKFTERGEVILEVQATPEGDGQSPALKLDFAVRDSGIGIPLDLQKDIFNFYAQADRSISRRYGGTGLGLAISSSLVNLMGGKLALRSRPGEGSCFYFTLHVKTARPEEQIHISDLYSIDLPRNELKKHWALLVDDTPTNLFLLETICQTVGLPYRTAENGRVAVERAKEQQFDLIFMDIQMPIMDGYTASTEIRKLPGYNLTPIIALTASAFPEDIDKAFAAGASGFIPKPFERGQLLLSIAEALNIEPERHLRENETLRESPEAAIVRQMHDFIRDQYQISLGEIKMILAQTVTDWRPLLDNLLAYSQQSNPEGTIAILQRLKGQLAAIGLLEFSEQTVTIMQAFRQNDRERARNLTVTFVQNLSRIFKALEQEVTTAP